MERDTPLCLGLSGLITRAKLPWGLARTLSRRRFTSATHSFPRVATARRYSSSPQDRPSMLLLRRSLYQVVSPASLFLPKKILCPTVGSFPYRDQDARLANFGIAFTGLCRSTCYCLLPPSPRRSIVPLRRHKGPTNCQPVYLAGQGLVRYRN